MTRRLFTLGVVVAVLFGADVAARGFVSSAVSKRAQQEAPPGVSVSASVGGFPFVPPLVLSGDVSRTTVHLKNVPTDVLVFSEISVDLRGVHLDRGRLFNDRKARIEKIDHGTVRATITEEALRSAFRGVPVSMTPGKLTIAGLDVTPSVRNKRLTIGDLPIPLTEYMPCVSEVSVEDGHLELSCTINDVPPALLDAVQSTIDN